MRFTTHRVLPTVFAALVTSVTVAGIPPRSDSPGKPQAATALTSQVSRQAKDTDRIESAAEVPPVPVHGVGGPAVVLGTDAGRSASVKRYGRIFLGLPIRVSGWRRLRPVSDPKAVVPFRDSRSEKRVFMIPAPPAPPIDL